MDEIRLPDSELKVMAFLWEKETASAKDTALYMGREYGWKKNTTYTVLKNLQEKGVIKRKEPGFQCIPLVAREQVGKTEARTLIDRFYKGSAAMLFSSFLDEHAMSEAELAEIRALLEKDS